MSSPSSSKLSLDNSAALTPQLGWQSWNVFHMNFNATLFVTIDGAGHGRPHQWPPHRWVQSDLRGRLHVPAHQGLGPWYNRSNESDYCNVIVRNETGH